MRKLIVRPTAASRGRRTALVVAAATGAVVLAGGIAYAAVPDPSGLIHGCYKTTGGVLRVIDGSTDGCKVGETGLNWNVQGTQGPQGPQGPQGLQGAQGVQGPGGVSGWEIVSVERTAQPSTDLIWTVPCSEGKKVLGGGVTKQIIGDSHVIESGPTDDGTAWRSGIDNTDDFPEPVTFYAICASV